MPERTKRKSSAGDAYIAPPVQRAVRLIRHVAEGNAVLNMSETAKTLKINRTTLLRLLHTLEVEGFVERQPNGAGYQVGLSFLELGARALFSQDLVQVAVPVLTRIAETLQLSAHLGVLDGTDMLYLVRRTPNTPLASNIRVGSRLPAHATTMGRMVLAYMPAVEIDKRYAGKALARFSEHTATTIAALHARSRARPQRRHCVERRPFRTRHQLGRGRGVRLRGHPAWRHQCLGAGELVRGAGASEDDRRRVANSRPRNLPPSGLDRFSQAGRQHHFGRSPTVSAPELSTQQSGRSAGKWISDYRGGSRL